MYSHVSGSQSGRHGRPENDAELQSSKAEAVQRPAPAVTRRQSVVQAKLSVGPADDVYEREADAVADRVVRSLAAPPVMSSDAVSGGADGSRIRRSAMPVSNITKIAPQIGRIRRFATVGVDGGELDADTDAAISASRGGGKAMGQDVRRTMEGAFGADFGGIRIHEGSKASELNNRIQAKAFTVGNDIYFRDGAPDASSRDGQHLLAHELTHTVQQGGGVQRSTGKIHTAGRDTAESPAADHGRSGGGGYLASASAAAASEVVRRLSTSSEQQVIRRTTSYAPLKPLLRGNNDIAVLEKSGHHISIGDPRWTYKFKEFHVTEEVGKNEDSNPHFFFGDNGFYKQKDSWAHARTDNYFNEIDQDQDAFTKTEDEAKSHAKDFLTDLRAKLAAAKPAAAAPAAAPAAAKPPPEAAAKEPEDDGFTVVGAKKGRRGR